MLGGWWVLLSLLLLVVGLASGQRIVVAVGSLTILGGGVSWLWNRWSLRAVSYARRLAATRAFIGEEIPLALTVANEKLLPLPWVEFEDNFPDGLELLGRGEAPSPRARGRRLAKTTSMAGYERVGWRYRLRCHKRGYFAIGPARLRSGDLFGFFSSTQGVLQVDHVLVYPRVVPLRDLALPTRRPFGERRSRERLFEDPSRILGLRDYRPGDPLRRVDWKGTARRQVLQSRVYEATTVEHLLLLLNLSTVDFVWEGYDPVLFERLVIAAASIATAAADSGASVGLLANGRQANSAALLHLPPSRDPRSLGRVMEALAKIGPLVTSPLEEVLALEARRFPFGSTLVCITALLGDRLRARLRALMLAGHPVVLVTVSDAPIPGLVAGMREHHLGEYLSEWDARAQ